MSNHGFRVLCLFGNGAAVVFCLSFGAWPAALFNASVVLYHVVALKKEAIQ